MRAGRETHSSAGLSNLVMTVSGAFQPGDNCNGLMVFG